jgi:hypothetical protein
MEVGKPVVRFRAIGGDGGSARILPLRHASQAVVEPPRGRRLIPVIHPAVVRSIWGRLIGQRRGVLVGRTSRGGGRAFLVAALVGSLARRGVGLARLLVRGESHCGARLVSLGLICFVRTERKVRTKVLLAAAARWLLVWSGKLGLCRVGVEIGYALVLAPWRCARPSSDHGSHTLEPLAKVVTISRLRPEVPSS